VFGELDKTMSPSKCRSVEIHETYSRNGCGKKVQIHEEKGEMKNLNESRMFHKFSKKHENNGRIRPLYLNSQSVSG
jgi:hypothetical protein